MALINFLKFSDSMGAIIADSEYWTPRFRRRLHTDNLYLLTHELSDEQSLCVAYGGVGHPSLHREVATHVQRRLRTESQSLQTSAGGDESVPQSLREVARIVFETMQERIRFRIDQKLLFKFGFTSADLARGYYENDKGERISITNAKIKEAAQKIATGKEREGILKGVFEAKAAVFGFDSSGLLQGFYLEPENGIMAYNHEGFEAIGTGKYASGMVFGKIFGAKTLAMRKAGFEPAKGIYELVRTALEAAYHFKEVGGAFSLILFDAHAEYIEERCRLIRDQPARLLTEIVKAHQWDEIDETTLLQLIEALIIKGRSWQEVEKTLFSRVQNTPRFNLLLRGYKKEEVDTLLKD